MNVDRFNAQMQSVVEWNAMARMGNDVVVNDETFNNQRNYTLEEIYETIAAFASGDVVETLDGIADVFVTLSYFWYMKNECVLNPVEPFVDDSDIGVPLKYYILQQLVDLLEPVSFVKHHQLYDWLTESIKEMYELMQIFEVLYGVDMHEVIDEVLESNWSKYPDSTIMNTTHEANAQCGWIEVNRGKENVRPVVYKGHWVFRDSYGTGKIMKPSTFKEPNIARHL